MRLSCRVPFKGVLKKMVVSGALNMKFRNGSLKKTVQPIGV